MHRFCYDEKKNRNQRKKMQESGGTLGQRGDVRKREERMIHLGDCLAMQRHTGRGKEKEQEKNAKDPVTKRDSWTEKSPRRHEMN